MSDNAGWVAKNVNSGTVLHLSTLDGWTVEQVVGEIQQHREQTVQELVTEIERLRSLHESAVQDWRNACELMNKAEAEVERLTRVVRKANDQTEHFERCWYLRGDEIERLRALLLDVRPDVEYAYINASGEGKTTRLNKLNRIHAALKRE